MGSQCLRELLGRAGIVRQRWGWQGSSPECGASFAWTSLGGGEWITVGASLGVLLPSCLSCCPRGLWICPPRAQCWEKHLEP